MRLVQASAGTRFLVIRSILKAVSSDGRRLPAARWLTCMGVIPAARARSLWVISERRRKSRRQCWPLVTILRVCQIDARLSRGGS